MKLLHTAFLMIFLCSGVWGQQQEFDLKKIAFHGLSFSQPKEIIKKKFGEPEVHFPAYECGFHADDQPGGPYYQLVYPNFNYIGSDTENFFLEHVEFDLAGKIRLYYKGEVLSGLMTKAEFAAILGSSAKEHFKNYPADDDILLFSEGSDDGARFVFKNEKLIRFEYWSPC